MVTGAGMPDNDEQWRDLAEGSRIALGLLGYHIGPECFPGEPDYCGQGYRLHAIAHLAALKAVADHHLLHFDPATVAGIFGITYCSVASDVAKDCHVTPMPGA